MKRIYKNWPMHNLIGHPLMQIFEWLGMPEIIQILTNSDAAVERAILAIYKRQTEDEQRTEETRHYNKMGFSGAHAHSGTYMACVS